MLTLERIGFALMTLLPLAMVLLYGGVHQPVIALFYLAAAILIVLWAAEAWSGGNLRYSRSYLQLPLVGLGLYALLQTIPFGTADDAVPAIKRTISADPFATTLAAIHILAMAAFFAFALVHISSVGRLRRLAAGLTVFGFAYAFFAVLQSVLSPEAIFGIYRPQASPFGSFVNRNDFAAVMVMLVSLPLGMLFSGTIDKDKRLLYGVAVAMMGTSILLSQSRGGFVAFLVEIILMIIFTSKARGKKDLLLTGGLSLLLIAAAVGGAVFVGGETSLGRFSGRDVAVEAPAETTSRAHIWGVTVKMIADNLPFGIGIGAYPSVYPQYDSASGYQRVEQAHNDYLQVASDAGIPGAALAIWFLFLYWRRTRESLRVTNAYRRSLTVGAAAGTGAVLLHSLFDFVLHITAVALIFLLLLAMLVAAGGEYEDDGQDDDPLRGRSRSGRPNPRSHDSVRRAA